MNTNEHIQDMIEQLYESYKNFKYQPHVQDILEIIFQTYAKQDTSQLKIGEFFQIIIEKGFPDNKFGFSFYFDLFNCIREIDMIEIQEEIQKKQGGKKGGGQGKDKENKQQLDKFEQAKKQEHEQKLKDEQKGKLTKLKFYFFAYACGPLIYEGSPKPFDQFIEAIQYEKTERKKDQFTERPIRGILIDENIKKLLTQELIFNLVNFESDLKLFFTIYMAENFENYSKTGQIMLSWDELVLLNKRLSSHSFLKFLSDSRVLPGVLTIEQFEEICSKITPPVNVKEQQYFSTAKTKQLYERELGKKPLTFSYEGDPLYSFFEFQFILGKIIFEQIPKDAKKDQSELLSQCFRRIFGLRVNGDQSFENLKQANSASSSILQRYLEKQLQKEGLLEQEDKKVVFDSDDNDDPQEMITRQLLQQQFRSQDVPQIDYQKIHDALEEELPKMPDLPVIVQEYPPSIWEKKTPMERIKDYHVIGEQPPKPPVDKNQKKQDKPKPKDKKGEREFLWEGFPPPDPKNPIEYLQEYDNRLERESELNDLGRGVMSNIRVNPVLIDEIIYPVNPPNKVKLLIESSIDSLAESDFGLAFKYLENAQDLWMNLEPDGLKLENQLFLEYFKGNIYLSAGRDDMALFQYFNCRNLTNKLSWSSPDKALPYSGLGNVLFRMQEYEFAIRCFLKARERRECTIGGDNVETASTYNNLGCCFNVLDRNKEAQTYYELAHAIFDLELGPYHQRTLTAQRNLMKVKFSTKDLTPAFKKPWVTYEQDKFAKQKATKKQTKKK